MSVATYTQAYDKAWVSGPGRYADNRTGSPALHYYFVEVVGWSEEEYAQHYPDK